MTSASRSRAACCDDRWPSLPDRRDPVPRRQEPGQGGLLDRLHLPAQAGQRPPPQEAQDIRIAPLPLGTTGPKLPAQDGVGGMETLERVLDRSQRHPPPRRRCRGEERSVGASPAGEESVECLHGRTQGTPRERQAAAGPRAHRGSGPRPRSRSIAPRRRSAPGPPAATPSSASQPSAAANAPSAPLSAPP